VLRTPTILPSIRISGWVI